jgi:hemerythrin-like domain-containing protein
MNILTKIASDHQHIRTLLNECDEVIDDEKSLRESTFDKLKSFVLTHHDAELSTLLNELTKHDSSRDKSMHLVEEHGEHKKVIDQLTELNTASNDWSTRYNELKHDILHHIDEEEQDLFNLAKETLSQGVLEKLGNKMVLITSE